MTGEVDCVCPLVRHVHGEAACYTDCGCRCLPCKLAYNERCYLRRAGLLLPRRNGAVSRVGTRRRIEALHAAGWSGGRLGELLGTSYAAVYEMRAKQRGIYPVTAQRVADLYNQLWNVEPPTLYRTKTLNWAKRMGFAPALAWDDDTIDDPAAEPWRPHWTETHQAPEDIDEIAVEEAMRGRPVKLTLAERAEAVRRLNERDLGAGEISERVGVTKRTVVRYRAAGRVAA